MPPRHDYLCYCAYQKYRSRQRIWYLKKKKEKKKMMIFLHAVRTEKGHTEFQQPINSISGLSSCYESPQQTKNKGH